VFKLAVTDSAGAVTVREVVVEADKRPPSPMSSGCG